MDNEKQSKEDKLLQIQEILQTLENGTSELYKSQGISPVWKHFMLIRDVKTKKRIEFVQCNECRTLLTFKEYSGTSHLQRHKCRIDQDAIEECVKYRTLSPELSDKIQSSLISNILKYCADDFVTYEKICNSTNFIEYAQSFVSLTLKHGSVCLKDLFPTSNAISREIAKFKDEKQHEIYTQFRQALNNGWCSASLNLQAFNTSMEKLLLIMRIQYYDNDLLALNNKVIFATPFDPRKTELFLINLVKQFKLFGGDEIDLRRIRIVTPNDKIFLKALEYPFSQSNCIVNTIIDILDEAFENALEEELKEFFVNCRSIVRYVIESEKYNFKLEPDNGSWKDKLLMLESINENYDGIVAISNNDNKFTFEFNKRKSEEVVSVLSPFIDAIDDLSAKSYTTANKIFVWWAVLKEHVETSDQYSSVLKGVLINAKDRFQSTYSPTMDDKINTFLDPRFKELLMLNENERAEVVKEVRDLLRDSPIENDYASHASTSSGIPKSKKSRLTNFESEKPKGRPVSTALPSNKAKGKYRFSKYEGKRLDEEEDDEVKIYLKLPLLNSDDFENEFDVIKKFWRSKQKTLPKLYKLATTRLHVPAYCGGVGLNRIALKEDLKDEYIHDLLFIRDNI